MCTRVAPLYAFFNVSVNGLWLDTGIPGVVGRFDSSNDFRVPHIGWNALQIKEDSEILDDIGNRHVYFVHSYRATPVHPLSFCLKRLPS
jgi:glutamine amidotransferase/cyclase